MPLFKLIRIFGDWSLKLINFVLKGSEPENEIPSSSPGATQEDDDEKHPPHIHSLDVQCSKTMMTINIEFNRVFNGVIYSKVNFKHYFLIISIL